MVVPHAVQPDQVLRSAIRDDSFASQMVRETRDWPQRQNAPAIDVDQLTDQIIRQIDSRATAWRERLGKV
jgi:hypothetical protein